jgi:hypothetical protein
METVLEEIKNHSDKNTKGEKLKHIHLKSGWK